MFNPHNVVQLDPLVSSFLSNNNQILEKGQIIKIQEIINQSANSSSTDLTLSIRHALFTSSCFWNNVSLLLQNSTTSTTMIYYLIMVKQHIQGEWFILQEELRKGFKNYIGKSIYQVAQMQENQTQENPFPKEKLTILKTMDQIVVEIIKCQWNSKWTTFIKDICDTADMSKIQTLNSLRILRMVFEQVFVFPEKNMTNFQLNGLRTEIQTHIPAILKHVYEMWFNSGSLASNLSRKNLRLRESLETMYALLSWIPPYFVYFSQIIKIIQQSLSHKELKSFGLACFQELLGISFLPQLKEYQESIRQKLLDFIFYILFWIEEQNNNHRIRRPKNKMFPIQVDQQQDSNFSYDKTVRKPGSVYMEPSQMNQRISFNTSLGENIQKTLISIFKIYLNSNLQWLMKQKKDKQLNQKIQQVVKKITHLVPSFECEPTIEIFELIALLLQYYEKVQTKKSVNKKIGVRVLLQFLIVNFPRPPHATFYFSDSEHQIIRSTDQFLNSLSFQDGIKSDQISDDEQLNELSQLCSGVLVNFLKSKDFYFLYEAMNQQIEIFFTFYQYNVKKMNSFIWAYRWICSAKENKQQSRKIMNNLIQALINAKQMQMLKNQQERNNKNGIGNAIANSQSNQSKRSKKAKFNKVILLQSLTLHLLIDQGYCLRQREIPSLVLKKICEALQLLPIFFRDGKHRSVVLMITEVLYSFSLCNSKLISQNTVINIIELFRIAQGQFYQVFTKQMPSNSDRSKLIQRNEKILVMTLILKSVSRIVISSEKNKLIDYVKSILQFARSKLQKSIANTVNQLRLKPQNLKNAELLAFYLSNIAQIVDFSVQLRTLQRIQYFFIYYSDQYNNNQQDLAGQVKQIFFCYKKRFYILLVQLIKNVETKLQQKEIIDFITFTIECVVKDFQKSNQYSKNRNPDIYNAIEAYFSRIVLNDKINNFQDIPIISVQKFNMILRRVSNATLNMINNETKSNQELRCAFFEFISNMTKNKTFCRNLTLQTLKIVIEQAQWALKHNNQEYILLSLKIFHNLVQASKQSMQFQNLFVKNFLLYSFQLLFLVLFNVSNRDESKNYEFQANFLAEISLNLMNMLNAIRVQSFVKMSDLQTVSNMQAIYNALMQLMQTKFANKSNTLHEEYLKKIFIELKLDNFIKIIKDYNVLLHRREFMIS